MPCPMLRAIQVVAVGALLMAAQLPSQAGFPERVRDAVAALDQTDYCQSPDSGTLAWAESYVLTAYCWMYEATGDRAWLDRVVRRADAIFANISSRRTGSTRDGRHPGWRTAYYSVALVEASAAPGNTSAATIRPDPPRIFDYDAASKVTGHTYRLAVTAASAVEITDTTAGQQLGAPELPPDGRITAIPGAAVVIGGTPAPGDRFRVTTQALKPLEYVVHDGMILTPIAQFCAAALGDDMGATSRGGREELARSARPRALEARYGAAARRYLRIMETQLIPKWDPYWRDVPGGGGVYIAQDDPAQRFPGATLPHNQYLALGRTHIALYRVTGKPFYRDRAERMARFFKSKLRLVGDHYEWNYWDAAGAWDDAEARLMQHIEDSSHGAIDVAFAVDAYDAGIVFDREDMQRLARTVSDAMWNHDYHRPRLGRVVNSAEGDTTNALEWMLLGRFSTRTRQIMVGLVQSLETLGLAEAAAGAQELAMQRWRWSSRPRCAAPPEPSEAP